jgi:hypothetical protein
VKARALFMEGDIDAARDRALAGVEACRVDLPLLCVDALTLLGQIAWSVQEREEAHRWYRQAITVLTGVGADREAGQLWFELGSLAAQAGLVAESADAFQRAAASTGLTARLPVVTPPSVASPQAVPAGAPAHARLPVVTQPPSPRSTPSGAPGHVR